MYCSKCGTQNPDDAKFCQKCGAALMPPVAAPPPTTTPPPAPAPTTATAPPTAVQTIRNSGMAVASLVLGIVGIFINFLSILAIIFGAIAIPQINKNPNLKGKGMAVAGLVLGIIVIVLWIVSLVWIGSFFWWLFR